MPPIQATIPVTPGVGLFLDAVSLTIGPNTVLRETVVLADPSNPTALAAVIGTSLSVTDPILDACITANVLAVSVTGNVTVIGTDADNAVNSTIKLPTLPARANASAPTWTEAHEAPLSVDLAGNLRTILNAETTKVIGTVNQGTSPWVVTASFSAAQHVIVDSGTITAVTSITNPVAVTGTFFQATQPVSIASGQVASGAFASGSIADGAQVTLGAKADAKSTATDTTAITVMQVLKEISFMEQNPASRAVTNAGTFAVQATLAAATTNVIGTVRIIGNVGGVMDTTLGSTAPANALQVGGYDGTNMQALAVDTAGVQKVRPAAPTTSLYTSAAITFSGSGANTIGPAASGSTTVRVYRMFIVNTSATTSTNITIQDSTVTAFSGAFLLLPGGSLSLDGKGDPLYISAAGKAIQLNSSVAVQISGTIWTTQS